MKFESTLSPGDTAFVAYDNAVRQLTIGLIRIECIDSPGKSGKTMFDNYKKQKSYNEDYMCIETGIGSGSVFRLGQTIFKTEEEAAVVVNEWRKKIAAKVIQNKIDNKEGLKKRIKDNEEWLKEARAELEEIEEAESK